MFGPTGTCRCCNGQCYKKFRIVAPDGKECCFPVAVPWWCCDCCTGTTGTTGRTAPVIEPESAGAPVAASPAPVVQSAPAAGSMSASQLLLQRYAIANPPRAFGKPYDFGEDDDTEREREFAMQERMRERERSEDYPSGVRYPALAEPDHPHTERVRFAGANSVLIPSEES